MVDGFTIESSGLPGKLDYAAAGILDDLGVETVGDGLGIGGIGDGSVIALDFVTCDAIVEVDGRCGNDVAIWISRLARRHKAAVVDDRHHLPAQVTVADGLHQAHEIFFRTSGEELVLGVVMMDAVREEHALCVNGEILELVAVTVPVVVLEDVLQNLADPQVVPPVLIPVYVAAPFGRLGEVINIFFLLKAEVLPSFDPVPHDAEVRKLVDKVLEPSVGGGIMPARRERENRACSCECHPCKSFHDEQQFRQR